MHLFSCTQVFYLQQGPGAEEPDDAGRTGRNCTPEINRTRSPKDHFTLVLMDGTECKFTEDLYPPNSSYPPDWNRLPAACRDIYAPDPDSMCYRSRPVKGVRVDFTIDVSCGCAITVDGVTHLVVNHDRVTLEGELP